MSASSKAAAMEIDSMNDKDSKEKNEDFDILFKKASQSLEDSLPFLIFAWGSSEETADGVKEALIDFLF